MTSPSQVERKSTTLLDLPYQVRKRIYGYCGLIRKCNIDLNGPPLWCMNRVPQGNSFAVPLSQNVYDDAVCDCASPETLPEQLLLVSKAFKTDVKRVFYQENNFQISSVPLTGFRQLGESSGEIVSSIRCLHLSFSFYYRHVEHVPFRAHRGLYHGSRSRSIGRKQQMGEDHLLCRLGQWMKLVEFLSSHIQPNYLHLIVSAQVPELYLSKLLESLELLPPLRSCSIEVSYRELDFIDWGAPTYQDFPLMVKHTTTRAVQPCDVNAGLFPFEDLPLELKQKILRHTPLIRPRGLVIWGANKRMVPATNRWSRSGFIHHTPTCCHLCNSATFFKRNQQLYPRVFDEDCTCDQVSRMNVASSSTTCICAEGVPTELFLVSHAMRRLAMEIYFSSNQFILSRDVHWMLDYRNKLKADISERRKTTPWSFFRSVPQEAWSLLRHVTLQAPVNFESTSEAFDYIDDALDCLGSRSDISKLSLTIDLTQELIGLPGTSHYGEIAESDGSAKLMLMETDPDRYPDFAPASYYENLLSGLRDRQPYDWKTLKDLFIHLSWPTSPIPNRGSLAFSNHTESLVEAAPRRVELEERLEKSVMGRDYDSARRRKVSLPLLHHGELLEPGDEFHQEWLGRKVPDY